MKKGLETLSREDLLVLLADQKQVIESLQHTYEQALQEKQKVLVEQAQQLNSHLQTIQAKDRQLAQKEARLRDTLFELDKLKKKIFGRSSERFVKLEGQLDLPFVKALSEEEQKAQEEKFERIRPTNCVLLCIFYFFTFVLVLFLLSIVQSFVARVCVFVWL